MEKDDNIDLRTCKKGDFLISIHGRILKYLRPTTEEDLYANYYDHIIEYENGSTGTRTHDGHTFRKNRLPSDEDIAKIIHLNKP